MAMVRFFLIAMLVLQAAGVPLAAESPCAAAAVRGEVCCMRQQADAGGDVMGHCGCQAAPESAGQEATVSTPAPPQVSVAAGISERTSVDALPAAGSDVRGGTTPGGGPIHSPPRLTGSGFRC